MINDAMRWDIAELVIYGDKPRPFYLSPIVTAYQDEGVDMVKVGLQVNYYPECEYFYFAAFRDMDSATAFGREMGNYVSDLLSKETETAE